MSGPPALRVSVDLEAVVANFDALRSIAGAEVAPVLKADAYGLGAARIARRLADVGAERFFVARVFEGEALRRGLQGRPAEIYVLDGCPPGQAGRLERADLRPCLNSLPQVAAWRDAGFPLARAALHVDTGMNRLGLRLEDAETLARTRPGEAPGLVMSHLACAGDPSHPMNAAQLGLFEAARVLFPRSRASLANTDGVFLGPGFRFDLVRPGLGLFGGGPFGRPHPKIRAVVTVRAPILQVRRVLAGESVGYGAEFRAERPMQVAIAAAGYADGVLRPRRPGGYGWLGGGQRPLIGRLSMDLIAFDVTDCPAAREGAYVELLGPNVPLHAAAAWAETSPYEILVGSDRRKRRWSPPRA